MASACPFKNTGHDRSQRVAVSKAFQPDECECIFLPAPFLMLPGQNKVVNPTAYVSDAINIWPALGCAHDWRHVCRGRRCFPALPGRREDDAFTNP